MVIALICALCSVKSDAKKSSRTTKVQPIAKPLKNSVNSKLNVFYKRCTDPATKEKTGETLDNIPVVKVTMYL
ncbi:hypothetical protein KSP40_PGU009360 [Platanthera guangdongensis]|uniref:Uncharacterized protein n=1 Tax=Platanthera guangdongensis TaxID=2320717 RepID=A0ABR2LR63_9ASPA